MKNVSKDEFYNIIGPQDACVRIENEYKWPYTTLFELRHARKLVGKIVITSPENTGHKYPLTTNYYLPD